MRLEGERLYYQTRLQVLPFRQATSPMPKVVREVCRWLALRLDRDARGPLKDACILDDRDFAYPDTYDGQAVTDIDAPASVRVATDPKRMLWAADFDKPDDNWKYMRWHTSVGVDDADGDCRVSIRVSTYMIPEYCCTYVPPTGTTTPRLVKYLRNIPGCVCICGNCPLTIVPVRIDSANWEDTFLKIVLDRSRTIPVVAMSSDSRGRYPHDPNELADALTGVAMVLTLNCANGELSEQLANTFKKGTSAEEWHIPKSSVRIFKSQVSFDERPDIDKTWLWRQAPENFIHDLRSALIDWSPVDKRTLCGVESVVRVSTSVDAVRVERRNNAAVNRLADANEELRKRLEETTDERDDWINATEDALNELDKKQEEVDRVRRAVADQLDVSTEQYSAAVSKERHLKNRTASLEKELASTKATVSHLQKELSAFENMRHLPTNLTDLLDFIKQNYSDRVVILDSAYDSAREFDGRQNLDEEWQILRSTANELWSLYFETDQPVDIAKEYQCATSYELALNETALTKENAECRRLRTFKYKGTEQLFITHIKGRATSKKDAFRVHYLADRQDRKIVIGHCGKHLKTTTRRTL